MRISKFDLFKFHPIFLSTVFQNLYCSFYCFEDMKELKGNNTRRVKADIYKTPKYYNEGPRKLRYILDLDTNAAHSMPICQKYI